MDHGLAKYQAKKLKAAGLQKLRFYCQVCKKQCRDANGFKNHLSSPSHQAKIDLLKASGGLAIQDYSETFLKDFMRLLRINHGTKRVNANKFYQEYIINDREHIHMNSTKWRSLTQFIKFLGSNGYVRVEQENEDDDSEFNLTIRYIDRSSEGIQGKENKSKNKSDKNDETVTRRILEQQMEIANKYADKSSTCASKLPIDTRTIKIEKSKEPIRLLMEPQKSHRAIQKPLAFTNVSESDEEEENYRDKKLLKIQSLPSRKINKMKGVNKRTNERHKFL